MNGYHKDDNYYHRHDNHNYSLPSSSISPTQSVNKKKITCTVYSAVIIAIILLLTVFYSLWGFSSYEGYKYRSSAFVTNSVVNGAEAELTGHIFNVEFRTSRNEFVKDLTPREKGAGAMAVEFRYRIIFIV